MHALIVYESVYGNTRATAEAIASGMHGQVDTEVLPVHAADEAAVARAQLVIAGGPTHMHGMTSALSRKQAVDAAEEEGVEVEAAAAEEPGLRDWLRRVDGDGRTAAAFDTRIDRSPTLTGAASRGIAKRLRRRGFELVADPESFFVEDSEGPLAEGERERATGWGERLARGLSAP